MTANWQNRTLWTGDNLDIMRGMNSASVDLIYLDPPFNSNRTYSAPIGSAAAGAAFKDTWTLSDLDVSWHGKIAHKAPALYRVIDTARYAHGEGMQSYLTMMAVRLLEMRRILKNTGSIYLHCDATASHYLKLVMDAVFGRDNFRNEIVWKRTSSKSGSRKFAVVHDVLLFYAASNKNTFNLVYGDHDPEYIRKFYRYEDKHGRYRVGDLTAAEVRTGDSGQPWRGIDVTAKGRHWGSPGTFPDHVEKPANWDAMKTQEKLDFLDAAGLIHWPQRANGVPGFKRYLSTSPGAAMIGMVLDIPPLSAQAKERLGYPTQKPLALLERLIKASSNPDEVVFDPFCGCATACVAAEKLNRQWAGVDLSPLAAELVKSRLYEIFQLFYNVEHREDVPKRADLSREEEQELLDASKPESERPYNCTFNKEHLFGKQRGNCAFCRRFLEYGLFEVDHITPRSKGGGNELANLQLLCSECNRKKGTRSMYEFKEKRKNELLREIAELDT